MEYKDVHSLLDNIAKSRVVTIVRSIDRQCADEKKGFIMIGMY